MYTQDGDSKYVANILSSMASRVDSIAVTTYAVPSTAYMSGISSATSSFTPTTSSLTPTTLANLEQTFIELQSVPVNTPSRMTQSGFVPPIVDPIVSERERYDYSDSSSDPEWAPAEKRFKMGTNGSSGSEFDPSITNPARKTHRRMRDEKLTPEEESRRTVRRERNKVAAAKCRQRRVDHTNILITETEKLETEQNDLETEIQTLQQQKDQLEFILQAHQPMCKVNGVHVPKVKVIKAEPVEDLRTCKASEKTLELTFTTATAATTTTGSSSASSRPSTLSLVKKEGATTSIPLTSAISLTTPSTGFYSFSLDTMVDHTGLTPLTGGGHTGLTPLTNGPTTCSSEVPRSSSESSDNATLISL